MAMSDRSLRNVLAQLQHATQMTADFFGATLAMRIGSTCEEKIDHGKEEQSEEASGS